MFMLEGRNPEDVLLVAVTKLHDVEEINEAIDCGITDIGENKVQEILSKYDQVKPVRWHFIGHLQTNKVDRVVGCFKYIHSVDSIKLAKAISNKSEKMNIETKILLQVNNAGEEQKFGYW